MSFLADTYILMFGNEIKDTSLVSLPTFDEFLYAFWNRQKKYGEEPFLDEMIYNVLDIKKNTIADYQTIRPIWYEYNGGEDVLYDKMIKEIEGKTFLISFVFTVSE